MIFWNTNNHNLKVILIWGPWENVQFSHVVIWTCVWQHTYLSKPVKKNEHSSRAFVFVHSLEEYNTLCYFIIKFTERSEGYRSNGIMSTFEYQYDFEIGVVYILKLAPKLNFKFLAPTFNTTFQFVESRRDGKRYRLYTFP